MGDDHQPGLANALLREKLCSLFPECYRDNTLIDFGLFSNHTRGQVSSILLKILFLFFYFMCTALNLLIMTLDDKIPFQKASL